MAKGKLKYSRPIITKIQLEPEQAILQSCVEGPGLIRWHQCSFARVWCYDRSGFTFACNVKDIGGPMSCNHLPTTEMWPGS